MEKYISIKEVLDNVLDHPMLKDVSLERAVNYAVHFMRIVGCPRMFEERTALVNILGWRGELPCDFNELIQVRLPNKNEAFRYSTDNFHMSDIKDNSELTYKIQGNIIFTSIKEGTIEIAYNAFVTDKEGYPMIPDNSSFIRALELYIKKQYFTVLFDLGKITHQVYNNVCQEYSFAVGQAQNDLISPTIDQMQSITNMWNTLIPKVSEHRTGFVNTGIQEKIRLQ